MGAQLAPRHYAGGFPRQQDSRLLLSSDLRRCGSLGASASLVTGGWPLRQRSSSSWSSHSGIACKKNDDELLHVVPENVAAGLRRLPSIPLHRLRGCDEGNSLTEKTFLRLVVRLILFVTVIDVVALVG
jgi:hypothetical protein